MPSILTREQRQANVSAHTPVWNPSEHPGMIMTPTGPVPEAEWKKSHPTGWSRGQILATLGLGGVIAGPAILGSLGGGGTAGAATVPGMAATEGLSALPAASAVPGFASAAVVPGVGAGGSVGILDTIKNAASSFAKSKLKDPSTYTDIFKAVSPVLGNAAANRANAQQSEEMAQQRRDQLNLQSAGMRENSILNRAGLDLDQRKFQVTAPGQRLSTGVRGSMVGNAHNITAGTGAPMALSSGRSITPVHFSGGGPDDLLSPDARALGDQVTHDMLMQEMAGDKFSPLPDASFPNATPAKPSGVVDKVLGTGSFVAGLGGALGPIISNLMKKQQQQRQPAMNYVDIGQGEEF